MEEEQVKIETKEIQCQSGKITYISDLQKVIDVSQMSFKYNEKNDIIKNVYEGGFKLWECTLDLIQYLEKQKQSGINYIEGKNVIDVGCGHGLLGIYAQLEKANMVAFQDFNIEVLNMVTMKNIQLNFQEEEKLSKQSVFLSGDWTNIPNKIDQQVNELQLQNQNQLKQYPKKYDLIMMSEVIYNVDNYKKVTDLAIQLLQPGTGICLMANKLFYFGCGGSMPEYTEYLEKNYSEVLQWETAEFINNKKGNKREIFALRLK